MVIQLVDEVFVLEVGRGATDRHCLSEQSSPIFLRSSNVENAQHEGRGTLAVVRAMTKIVEACWLIMYLVPLEHRKLSYTRLGQNLQGKVVLEERLKRKQGRWHHTGVLSGSSQVERAARWCGVVCRQSTIGWLRVLDEGWQRSQGCGRV